MILFKKIFCFIGLPCSGKSRAIKTISNDVFENRCTVISCGDIARKLSTTKELRDTTSKNDQFPLEDSLRNEILKQISESDNVPILIDGCPRFADQANWAIDTFWVNQPEFIEVNTGDMVTLFNRAKMRGRESDTDFASRLAIASKNINDIHNIFTKRLIKFYTLHNGDDEYVSNLFATYFKNVL